MASHLFSRPSSDKSSLRNRLRRVLLESLERREMMAADIMDFNDLGAPISYTLAGQASQQLAFQTTGDLANMSPDDVTNYLDTTFGSTGGDLTSRSWFPLIQESYSKWSQQNGLAFSYTSGLAAEGEGELVAEGEAGGPRLLSIAPNSGNIFSFNNVNTLTEAPTELVFRFDGASTNGIDSRTLANGIKLIRANRDGSFTNGNEQIITPGYLSFGDNTRIVVMRFATTLPDDLYRVMVIGTDNTAAGETAIRSSTGNATLGKTLDVRSFDSTPTDLTRDSVDFKIELGAQVVSVVPQPIDRIASNTVTLAQTSSSFVLRSHQGDTTDSAAGTAVNLRLVQTGPVTDAAYDKANNRITVSLAAGATVNDVVAAINNKLSRNFSVTTVTNGAAVVNALDLGNRSVAFSNWSLDPKLNQIRVYFNDDDLFASTVKTGDLSPNPTVVDPAFYQLILTKDTVQPGDDLIFSPTSISYDPSLNLATLTYGQQVRLDLLAGAGTYRLRIGGRDVVAGTNVATSVTDTKTITPINLVGDQSGDFTGASNAAGPFAPVTFNSSTSITVNESIVTTSTGVLPLDFPGSNFEPGHRDIQDESHINSVSGDASPTIETIKYNFALNRPYGLDAANRPVSTSITSEQIARVREIFEFYSQVMGVDFVETESDGKTIVVGDMFPNGGTPSGPGGIIGVAVEATGLAIFDGAEVWDNSFGGQSGIPGAQNFFTTAMHEIGHLLKLGHASDQPVGTIMTGSSTPFVEWDFPGDVDVTHGQYLYRPDNRDVDSYKFIVPAGKSGLFTAETFAERLPDSSNLDTYLTLYKETPTGFEVVAINNDSFSSDSFLSIKLKEGTYYISVTGKGNENVNPLIANTGDGAVSQGNYQLKMDFKEEATAASIVDPAGSALDGDGDGLAGGNFNFWFRTAAPADVAAANAPKTIYVDKGFAGASTGSAAAPMNNLDINNPVKWPVGFVQPGDIIRVVGSLGADRLLATGTDNPAYEVGRGGVGNAILSDGITVEVPQGVTLMVDAGAIFKMGNSRITAGSLDAGISKSFSSMQVLGTPRQSVNFTSYNDQSQGTDTNPLVTTPQAGDWGGLDLHNNIDRQEGRGDYERQGIFLNFISFADLRYGGGQITVSSPSPTINPINLNEARPTLLYNTISFSADAAISADPNSFEETTFTEPRYQLAQNYRPDYDRVGPDIRGNILTKNSANGLFVKTQTAPGSPLTKLETAARWDDTDITYVIGENLIIAGTPGGAYQETTAPNVALVQVTDSTGGTLTAGQTVLYKVTFVDRYGGVGIPSAPTPAKLLATNAIALTNLPTATGDFVGRRLWRSTDNGLNYRLVAELDKSTTSYTDVGADLGAVLTNPNAISSQRARLDSRLQIDPGVVVKLVGSRIEVDVSAQLIAEGSADRKVIFTSRSDDRFGAGGTFDTNNNGAANPGAGDWSGIVARHLSSLSIDQALITYGGGQSSISGGFAGFSAVEVHQAEARIANSILENNASGKAGIVTRDGRGPNDTSVIYVTGSQPVIVENIIRNNLISNTAAISVNANAMSTRNVQDHGRQTGAADRVSAGLGNSGPLVDGNSLIANGINGLRVRGETLTTATVWDDTDIVHVLQNEVVVPDLHTYGGMRLQSKSDESLVVKLGVGAGFTATGTPLDITDRIGGSLQIMGAPGFPVVLTALGDDSVGAGFDPNGSPLLDTDNATTPIVRWRSVKLDPFSNDRNLETGFEYEADQIQETGVNDVTTTAQSLGSLAPSTTGGDENLRLGFTQHGSIAAPQDLDVYSFIGTAGTPVWIDIDQTNGALDTVVELLDSSGTIIAQSDSSLRESLNPSLLFVTNDTTKITRDKVQPLDQDPFAPKNSFQGTATDLYSVNPLDAGMRVVLPGTIGGTNTYYVRVRSSNLKPNDPSSKLQDPAQVRNGLTTGAYRLQLRMQQNDETAGSTVRFADVRFATNGIEVNGLPAHSPLLGQLAESNVANNILNPTNNNTLQRFGNIAQSDRASVSLGGSLVGAGDIDLYSFEVKRQSTQSGSTHISTVLDIDYADGLGRADTTLWVYRVDANFNNPVLVLVGSDSNVADDQAAPGQGTDLDALSRGSAGTRDPFIGASELPDGNYVVAVSNNSQLAVAMQQFQLAGAANPNIRLEPINSVNRLFVDRVGPTATNTAQVIPASIAEVEPNNSMIEVQNLDNERWQLTADPNITQSTAIPHLTINGTGDGTFDYYSFTVPTAYAAGVNAFFDIDGTSIGFNTELFLYDSSGNLVAQNDTAVLDAGSSTTNDSFITHRFTASGKYILAVGRFNSVGATGGVTGVTPQVGDTYTLNISLLEKPVNLFSAVPTDGNIATENSVPWTLADVTAYVVRSTTTGSALVFGNAMTGVQEAEVSTFVRVNDAAISPDGRLVGYQIPINVTVQDSNSGSFHTINSVGAAGTAGTPANASTVSGNSGIRTFTTQRTDNTTTPAFAVQQRDHNGPAIGGNTPIGDGMQFNGLTFYTQDDTSSPLLMFGVASRGNGETSYFDAVVTNGTVTGIGANVPNSTTNIVYKLDPNTGAAINPNGVADRAGVNIVNDGGAGTDKVEFGRFVSTGTVTGLAEFNGRLYGVSTLGELFEVNAGDGTVAFGDVNPKTIVRDLTLQPIAFTSLTAGPRNLENGRFSQMLFGTTADGTIWAFDANGAKQPVFPGFSPFIKSSGSPLNINAANQTEPVTGIDFSMLDVNLWHRTATEPVAGGVGHGRVDPFDRSQGGNNLGGGDSLYFGYEAADQLGDWQGAYNVAAYNRNYNLPGGARGAIVSNPIDLRGYSASDLPMLYFNYFLQTDNVNSPLNDGDVRMNDAFRVYGAGEDGQWILLTSNNTPQSSFRNNGVDEFDNTINKNYDPFLQPKPPAGTGLGNPLYTQETFDNTGAWRQARTSLAAFAGKENVRLRFEFSTGASFRTGDPMLGGVELTALAGSKLVDGGSFTVSPQENVSAVGATTFELDMGLVLDLPGGASIPDGSTITINTFFGSRVVTFSRTDNTGNNVLYLPTDAPATIANKLASRLPVILGVNASTIRKNSARPNILNISGLPGFGTYSTSLTAGVIAGTPGVTPGNVAIAVNQSMTDIEVRDTVRAALAARFNSTSSAATANASPLQAWPVHNATLRLFKFNVFGNTSGLGLTTNRPGDQLGVEGSTGNRMDERAQNTAGTNFGVFLDDFIVGFAERGEMVFNSNTVEATSPFQPNLDYGATAYSIAQPETGPYQLTIRTAAEYGITNGPDLVLRRSFDTNARLSQQIGIQVAATTPGQLTDGMTFSLSDGTNQVTFEFDVTVGAAFDVASGVASGNVPIRVNANATAAQIATAIRDAINSAPVQSRLKINAGLQGEMISSSGADLSQSGSTLVMLHGSAATSRDGSLAFNNAPFLSAVSFGTESPMFPPSARFGEDLGDSERQREQGQIVLFGNTITDSGEFGIKVDAGARTAIDRPLPGSPVQLPTTNQFNLAPGVVIVNNILANNVLGGARISGDASGGNLAVPSLIARVVNNTIFAGADGILVDEGASPTILNNIITRTTRGVNVVGAVASPVVLGANVFQSNGTDTVGTGVGSFAEQLLVGDPLFVNTTNRRFYLAAGSKAIDSSLEALQERPELTQVKNSVFLPLSPMLAPEVDVTGQRRVDDPSVNSPAGLGGNVFKDRGAVDRSDFLGLNAVILQPQDNDSKLNDIDRNTTFIQLTEGELEFFSLLLQDTNGTGPDETTVIASGAVTLTENGRLLLPGVDYVFGYNANSRTIRLTPIAGIWRKDSVYEISLNNRSGIQLKVGAGIADGNRYTVTYSGGTKVFEFDTGTPAGVTAGAVPVKIQSTFTAYQSAAQLVAAINGADIGLTAYLQGDGTLMVVGATSIAATGAALGTPVTVGAIRDLAGNALFPNRANSLTQFTIVMPDVKLDFGDALGVNTPTIKAPNSAVVPVVTNGDGARHGLLPIDLPLLALGSLADPDSDGIPSAAASSDNTDNSASLGTLAGAVFGKTGAATVALQTAIVDGMQFSILDGTAHPLATTLINTFSGNGATTTFALSSAPVNPTTARVTVGGVVQPQSAYSFAGASIVFTVAPVAGLNNISVFNSGVVFEFNTDASPSNSSVVPIFITAADTTPAAVATKFANAINGAVLNGTTVPAQLDNLIAIPTGSGNVRLIADNAYVLDVPSNTSAVLSRLPLGDFSIDLSGLNLTTAGDRAALDGQKFSITDGSGNTVQFELNQLALFSGNGTQTVFTIPTVNPATAVVRVGNVVQSPSTYTIVGNTLTFNVAPPTGTNNILLVYPEAVSTGSVGIDLDYLATTTTTATIASAIATAINDQVAARKLVLANTTAVGSIVFIKADDDEGVTFKGTFNAASNDVIATVTSTGAGMLDAWIDWNADGDFNDAGEQIRNSFPVQAGVNNFSIKTPLGAVPGFANARFRLSTLGGTLPGGVAIGGEVEDYVIEIVTGTPPVAVADTYATNEDTVLSVKTTVIGNLAAAASAGQNQITLSTTVGLAVGHQIMIKEGLVNTEFFTVSAIAGNVVTLSAVAGGPATLSRAYTVAATITTVGVLGNDTDADNDPLASILTPRYVFDENPSTPAIDPLVNVTNGTLLLNLDGTFTYTPNLDFNGVDSFTYNVVDNRLRSNNPVVVTIRVNPINDAPLAKNDTIGQAQGAFEDATVVVPGALITGGADPDVAHFRIGTGTSANASNEAGQVLRLRDGGATIISSTTTNFGNIAGLSVGLAAKPNQGLYGIRVSVQSADLGAVTGPSVPAVSVVGTEVYSGDGTRTSFGLTKVVSGQVARVLVGGVLQPQANYVITDSNGASNVTFTVAPPAGAGNVVVLTSSTINVTLNNRPGFESTVNDFIAAINSNLSASTLVTASLLTGAGTASIGAPATPYAPMVLPPSGGTVSVTGNVLTYVPPLHYNNNIGGPALLLVTIEDDLTAGPVATDPFGPAARLTSSATLTVNLAAVNDRPEYDPWVGNKIVDTVEVPNDNVGAFVSIPKFITGIRPGPLEAVDEGAGPTLLGLGTPATGPENQTISFPTTPTLLVEALTPLSFAVQPTITVVGTDATLEFQLAQDVNLNPVTGFPYFGPILVRVTAQDSGAAGGTNNELNRSIVRTFTILPKAVNDAPEFTIPAVASSLEDQGLVTIPGFMPPTQLRKGPATARDEAAMQSLRAEYVYDASAFLVPPSIDLVTGNLTYQTNPHLNRFTGQNWNVSVTIIDDRVGSDPVLDPILGRDRTTKTFLVDVQEFNDAPNYAFSTTTLTSVDEDPFPAAGVLTTIPNFIPPASIVPGPAEATDEGPAREKQSIRFIVTARDPSHFDGVAGLPQIEPTVLPDGSPNPNAGMLKYRLRKDLNTAAPFTPIIVDVIAVDSGLPSPTSVVQFNPAITTPRNVNATATRSFTILPTPVNDAPEFLFVNEPNMVVSSQEDQGVVTRPLINPATIFTGPASASDERLSQTFNSPGGVTFVFDPSIFDGPGGFPTLNLTTGNVTYKTAPNVNRFTPGKNFTVSVTLKDDGGTLRGGIDSFTKSFSIDIQEFNDAPDYVMPTTITSFLEDPFPAAGALTTFDAFIPPASIVVGPSTAEDEVVRENQSVRFIVTARNPALFDGAAGLPKIEGTVDPVTGAPNPNAGRLTYRLRKDINSDTAFPAIIVDVIAVDSGLPSPTSVVQFDPLNTTPRNVNATATRSFTIQPTPVNDAPEFSFVTEPNMVVSSKEDEGVVTRPLINPATIFTGPAGAADERLRQTFNAPGGVTFVADASIFDGPAGYPTLNLATGNVTYKTAPNINRLTPGKNFTISVTLTDDGGTANGGVNSFTKSFTIDIEELNDAPEYNMPTFTSAFREDPNAVGLTTVPNFVTGTLPGPSTAVDELNQTVRFQVDPINATTGAVDTSLFDLAVDPVSGFNGVPRIVVVGDTGTLIYRLRPDINQMVPFPKVLVRVIAIDDGKPSPVIEQFNPLNTTLRNINAAASRTFTILPDAINDAPTFTINPARIDSTKPAFPTVNAVEDTLNNVTVTDFLINLLPGPASALDELVAQKIKSPVQVEAIDTSAFSTLPTLTLVNDLSVPGQNRYRANLTFKTAQDVNSNTGQSLLVRFRLQDDGGTANTGDVDITDWTTISISVAPVNDVPIFTLPIVAPATTPVVSINEDTPFSRPFATNIFASDLASATDERTIAPWKQSLSFVVTSYTNTGLFSTPPAIDATTGVLSFVPAPEQNGQSVVVVVLRDSATATTPDGTPVSISPTQTFTININPINDAPEFSPGTAYLDSSNNWIANSIEDQGAVSKPLFATNLRVGPILATDERDLPQQLVVHVEALDPTAFIDQPSVDASGTLTYRTAKDVNSDPANGHDLRVRIYLTDDGQDSSLPPNNNKSVIRTFTIIPAPINDAPVFTLPSNQAEVIEDVEAFKGVPQTVFPGFATGIKQAAGLLLPTPNQTALDEATQVLRFDVISVSAPELFIQSADPLVDGQPKISPDGQLSFKTAPHKNGKAVVVVRLVEPLAASSPAPNTNSSPNQTFTISITPVNDAPQFNIPTSITYDEDAGLISRNSFATDVRRGPVGSEDENVQEIRFVVEPLDRNSFTPTGQPAIGPDGTLTFQTALNANIANADLRVRVTLIDNGANSTNPLTDPNSNQSVSKTFTLDITPVNDPPIPDAFVKTINEDESVTVLADDVLVGDRSGPTFDENNQLKTMTQIERTSAKGGTITPTFVGNNIVSFQYIPPKDLVGTDTFLYVVTDNGSPARSGTGTITISLTGVNDPPQFVKGSDQIVPEDAPLVSVAGWATSILPGTIGAVDELSTQTVSFTSTVDKPALFEVPPSVASDGTLSFKPKANANGLAVVTVFAVDNGAIPAQSPAQTFTISIVPVNDAPVFTAGPTVTVLEDSGAYSQPWATRIAPAAGLLLPTPESTDESTQVVDFTVVADKPSLFSVQPTIDSNGRLQFTPNRDAFGTALLTVRAVDRGPSGGLDQNTSAPQTLTITITSGNDAPIAVADTFNTNENSVLTVTAPGLLANDTDVDLPNDVLAAVPGTVQSSLGATVTINANGSITYDPSLVSSIQQLTTGQSVLDTFVYKIKDSAGTESIAATVTVNVAGVNDAPTAVNDAYTVGVSQDQLLDVLKNDTDIDSPINAASISITSLPAFGTVVVNQTGVVQYTPGGGFRGVDTFRYTVRDTAGNVSNEAVVTVTVNNRPIANTDTAITFKNQSIDINVLANDSDLDGTLNPASVQIVLGPTPSGTATVLPNGSIRFVPATDFSGSVSLSYVVSDNVGTVSNVANVDVRVQRSKWQNPRLSLDVNADTFISPIDALLIINRLNDPKFVRDLRVSNPPTPPFLDVNGDEVVSPIDALLVINFLNSARKGSGEGESLVGEGESNLSGTTYAMMVTPQQMVETVGSQVVQEIQSALNATLMNATTVATSGSSTGASLAGWFDNEEDEKDDEVVEGLFCSSKEKFEKVVDAVDSFFGSIGPRLL